MTATAVTTAAAAASVVLGGAAFVAAQDQGLPTVDNRALLRLGSGSGSVIGEPASVVAVADDLDQVDAAALVKAAGLAQKRAQAQAQAQVQVQVQVQEQARAVVAACPPNAAGFGAVKPWVATAGYFLRCAFNVETISGVAGRAGTSDHPLGLALDFMVDRATGDGLADCALRNKAALGISYVIWRQRINYGNGWQAMEDRGSTTANHYDHVHISFAPRAGSGSPQCGPSSA